MMSEKEKEKMIKKILPGIDVMFPGWNSSEEMQKEPKDRKVVTK